MIYSALGAKYSTKYSVPGSVYSIWWLEYHWGQNIPALIEYSVPRSNLFLKYSVSGMEYFIWCGGGDNIPSQGQNIPNTISHNGRQNVSEILGPWVGIFRIGENI